MGWWSMILLFFFYILMKFDRFLVIKVLFEMCLNWYLFL